MENYTPPKNHTPTWFKKQIQAHYDTIDIYLSQFKIMWEAKHGKKPLPFKKHPSIRWLVGYLKKNQKWIIKDFVNYLENKTHYSYSLRQRETPLKVCWTDAQYKRRLARRKNDKYAGMQSKLGQFVLLILSEYIILHNRMFVSGLKLKQIKSIDRFLKNVEVKK